MALCSVIAACSLTGDACLTIYIDLMVCPLACHLSLLPEPVSLPSMDMAFQEECFLSLLSLQLRFEDEDFLFKCLET